MTHTYLHRGAFWWLSCKEFAYDAGYLGLIPGLGRKGLPERDMATHSSILA